MNLTALQSHNIEQALSRGRRVEAVKIYREAQGCDLSTANAAVADIAEQLKARKPWLAQQIDHPNDTAASGENPAAGAVTKRRLGPAALAAIVLVDMLVFAGLAYYFFMRDNPATVVARPSPAQGSQSPVDARPKAISLPGHIDTDLFTAPLGEGDNFASLYRHKIATADYIRRKGSSASRDHDDSLLERQIKTARRFASAARQAPAQARVITLHHSTVLPQIDGVIDEAEWQDASQLLVDEAAATRLYLKVVGPWLLLAGDVPRELSSGGYDQFRAYFHPGLLNKLVNERLHVGRGPGVTSIRQTRFRWQGSPPDSDRERWKKYRISDWGLYHYAYGSSSMFSGHRQYELAVHLGEAGLHPGVPFTFYLEVETDPLKNEQGKFVERQYLGTLGSEQQPVWLQF